MPKDIEKALKRKARNKGLKGEDADDYVYGTLAKIEKKRKKRGKRK